MKKADTKNIKDALQLEREIYELTRGKSLVCPSGKRSHTKANVLKQESMSGTLGICVKCGKPLIPPVRRIRRSWVDLSTELVEIDNGDLLRVDGSGGPEPELEVAALAAHLVHHEGVDLARVEVAVDRGDLEAKWSRQCAMIRQQRDFVGILFRDNAPTFNNASPQQTPLSSNKTETDSPVNIGTMNVSDGGVGFVIGGGGK